MEKQFYNFVKEVYDKQLGVEGIAIADGRANFLQNIMKSRTEWRIVWEKSRQKQPIQHILAGARSEA